MKKRICMAMGVLVIMMSIFAPMISFAEPEDEKPNNPNPPAEEPKEPTEPTKPEKPEEPVEKPATEKKETENNQNKTENNNNNQYYNGNTFNVPIQEPVKESNIDEGVISVIFTHDMHSHIDSEKVVKNGKTVLQGGFARMATAFQEISPNYKEDSYLLDGGDFSMGTGYQTIYADEASELRMMAYLGYDGITIGNHEFDYRSAGLSSMLKSAIKKHNEEEKGKLPKLLLGNVDWDKTLADKENKDAGEKLKSTFEKYGVEENYTVIKKNGTRIAVFGIFGEEADEYAPESGTKFKEPKTRAKEIVEEINKNEKKIDLIVCLSHSGTNEDKELSEDEALAKEVPDIDLIVSGHSHTELKEPIKVGNTVIASCGEYTRNIGHVTFKKEKNGEYALDEYKLIPMNESVEEEAQTLLEAETFKEMANSEYFSKYGYSLDTILTKNNIQFTEIDKFGEEQGEEPLGNLLADSYIYSIKKAEKKKYEKVDVAIVPKGVIRASLPLGDVSASDAFNILSLGVGKDGTPGYPLVSMYLTGKELKSLAEVDATVSGMMPEARLYMGGMSYTINDNRLIMNRAVDVCIGMGKDAKPVENKKLYRVVSDLYSCQMLASVKDESYGFLSIVPKDKDGNVVVDYEDYILKNRKGKELKAWYAVATYLDSMTSVSKKYEGPEGRKILSDSKNIVDLIKQPNKVGWLVRLAILVPILIIGLIILLIVRRKRKRRAGMMFSVSDRQKRAMFAPPKKQKNLFAKRNRRWFK